MDSSGPGRCAAIRTDCFFCLSGITARLVCVAELLADQIAKASRENKLIKCSFAMEGVRNSSRREIGPA
jgi:hypothetical protein